MRSIVVDHVSLRYRRSSRAALQDVTCELRPGVTGLVGVNGAGKSSLLSLIATGRRPSSGRITWDESEPSLADVRRETSWVPQAAAPPRNFTAEEFLTYGCFLKNVPRRARTSRVEHALESVCLLDSRRVKCGALSGGQVRRLGIAWGMLSEPQVLLLDEPTAGLDVYQRRGVRELMRAGLAPMVVVSSHSFNDLESVADRLLVLDSGRLVFEGSMQQVRERLSAVESHDPEERFVALLDSVREVE